jgi:hypothetical protein
MSKNHYRRQAEKESLLGSITKELPTEGNVKNSAIETVKDIVIGVVAGGVTGSAIGRASFLIGAAVSGLGHYYKHRLASIFGVGMMAANGFQSSGVNGLGEPEGFEGVKERVMNFKDTFSQKLYLDKLPMLKSKQKKEATNGMGDVQYFTYPESKELLGEGSPDLTSLDRIEKQIADSAASFSQIHGNLPSMEGTEDGSGLTDLNDRLF